MSTTGGGLDTPLLPHAPHCPLQHLSGRASKVKARARASKESKLEKICWTNNSVEARSNNNHNRTDEKIEKTINENRVKDKHDDRVMAILCNLRTIDRLENRHR